MKFKTFIMYSMILVTNNNYSMDRAFRNFKILTCSFPPVAIASEARWNKQAFDHKKDHSLHNYNSQDFLSIARTTITTGLALATTAVNYELYGFRKPQTGTSPGVSIAQGIVCLAMSGTASFLGYSIISYGYYKEWKDWRTAIQNKIE